MKEEIAETDKKRKKNDPGGLAKTYFAILVDAQPCPERTKQSQFSAN